MSRSPEPFASLKDKLREGEASPWSSASLKQKCRILSNSLRNLGLIGVILLMDRCAESLKSLSHLLKCRRVNLPACIALAEYLER